MLSSWEDFGKCNPNEKGAHTPCQVLCGRRLFVMCVEHLRKSMDLSERETIGPLLGRHLKGFGEMKWTRRWSGI